MRATTFKNKNATLGTGGVRSTTTNISNQSYLLRGFGIL